VTGMELPFLFVAVEKEAPHAVAVYRADPEIIEVGRKKYRAALQLLKWCQESRATGRLTSPGARSN
jgi:hypothetical protein